MENQDNLPKQNPVFLYVMAGFIAIVATIILIVDGKKMKENEAETLTPTEIVESSTIGE